MFKEIISFNKLVSNSRKDASHFPTLKIALLGDTATQLLAKAIRGYGIEKETDLVISEADYNQLDYLILNQASSFYDEEYHSIILFKSALKLLHTYYELAVEDKVLLAEQVVKKIQVYIENINHQLTTRIILFNFEELPDMVFNHYGNKVDYSWIYQVRKLNFLLMDLAIKNNNVFICDIASLHNQLGRNFCFDPKTYIRADITNHIDFLPFISQSITNIILANHGKFKKCLILDLDNTLWGGVIGDDGLEKIQLGKLGLGKAFTELQLWAKNLKERGIVLAVCSKNTESIAKEPFERHPDMVLKLDDIAVFVANWENKADNIRYIQSILNIGFDSMVFLDDNPFERDLVKRELPEVTVPNLPKDPSEYMTYLQQLNLFETASYSRLDTDRTKKYQQEAERTSLQSSFTSLKDYIRDLDMVATTKPFDEFHIPRIVQLIQRSNQFNLRTIRYSEKEVCDLMNENNVYTLYCSLSDKFGDYGLISVIILKALNSKELFIDTWIMSCRVLKRTVEEFVTNRIVEIAIDNGFDTIIGERIPTKKNIIVAEHYKNLGFKEKENKWHLDVNSFNVFDSYINQKTEILN